MFVNRWDVDARCKDFVDHPRYGRCPGYTGLNPENFKDGVFLHWNIHRYQVVAKTAIVADTSKQVPATIQVTHYFDVIRKCRVCRGEFIFFAKEQRYWYEELKFKLECDCVDCFPCRQKLRTLEYFRVRYEELVIQLELTDAQCLELGESCLCLIEAEIFHSKKISKVREMINRLALSKENELLAAREKLLERVKLIEQVHKT